jgi:DNA-binding transcriptional regulator YdaS (Cro superfamily)
MAGFPDFVAWAGSQRAAAEILGLHESTVSLIVNGKRELQPEHARMAEAKSGGVFRCEMLLPSVDFIREGGEVVAYRVSLEAANDA